MKKLRFLSLLLLFLPSLFGCYAALNEHAEHYQIPDRPQNGFVFIYRELDYFTASYGLSIYSGEKKIGAVNVGTYFVLESPPGDIEIDADIVGADRRHVKKALSIKAGEKYYVKVTLVFTTNQYYPKVELVDPKDGVQSVSYLKYATLD